MDYRAIIITGTSGSGKSTVANKLINLDPRFARVQAVTTRDKRESDVLQEYAYLSDKQFEIYAKQNKLLVKASYKPEATLGTIPQIGGDVLDVAKKKPEKK